MAPSEVMRLTRRRQRKWQLTDLVVTMLTWLFLSTFFIGISQTSLVHKKSLFGSNDYNGNMDMNMKNTTTVSNQQEDHDIILSRPSSDHIDSDAATRDSSDGHGHAGESSTTPSVQTLILHVGPQKTGSTSVQMNAIRSWKTRKVFRQSDHFQEIGQDFSYTKFRLLREECLEERKNKAKARHQGSNKNGGDSATSNTHDNIRYDDSCTHIHDIKAIYKEAYNKLNTTDIDTDTPFPIYNTLHSNEEWSLLPHSPTNSSFALLRDLILPWDDIHIVIFYRPFQDWITSKYLQYRKHMVVNARRIGKGFWKERYLIGRNEQMLFPNFFRRLIHPHNDYDDLRDTLGTYEYFQHFASYLEHSSINSKVSRAMLVVIIQKCIFKSCK